MRAYDLSAVLYEHVNRFPPAQRTLLGRIVLDDARQMLGDDEVEHQLERRNALGVGQRHMLRSGVVSQPCTPSPVSGKVFSSRAMSLDRTRQLHASNRWRGLARRLPS